MSEDRENYWLAVREIAENVYEDHRTNGMDMNDLIHEHTDQHPYVVEYDLQQHTLEFSNYPCIGITENLVTSPSCRSSEPFPYAAFACAALQADVREFLSNSALGLV